MSMEFMVASTEGPAFNTVRGHCQPASIAICEFAVRLICKTPQVGNFDPVTRKHTTSKDVVQNLQLRAATEHYLEEHPWAWADVC